MNLARKRLASKAFAILVVLGSATLIAAPGALAGLDIPFPPKLPDMDLFVKINSRFFDRDEAPVRALVPRLPHPDLDLPVVLMLSQQSGRPCDEIVSLRRSGLSWWTISTRLRVPPRVFFVETPVDPGPPYGHAYGYWRKHGRDPHARYAFSDDEVRDLVALRVAHGYYGMPVGDVQRMRAAGTPCHQIIVNQYRSRHEAVGREHRGHDDDHGDDDHDSHGHGNGHAYGHDKHD